MKKIKQISLKAMLLTILAVLTIGFTGCSDELSGDQTQGKPGYLTINVKTLKPLQTKLSGDHSTDYQKITTMDVFVFNSSDQLLIHKFVSPNVTSGSTLLDIPVNQLAGTEYVVVVANYDATAMTGITDLASLESKQIITVKDFSSTGLHMTGRANIQSISGGYVSNVKIAPVEAKITVKWTTADIADNYDITGIYVVNAISKTTLPIIRQNTWTSGDGWLNPLNLINVTPSGYINYKGTASRTALNGLSTIVTTPNVSDFDFYNLNAATSNLLYDEPVSPATALLSSADYHYYVGENYSNNTGVGTGIAVANTDNANTLVVIKVTPKTSAPQYIIDLGDRYYTYEFNKASTYVDATNLGQNGANLGSTITEGFSVRRKTNYILTFNLSGMGAEDPYTRVRNLRVNVEANAWDTEGVNPNF
ncbi:MAG TPA: hypothetical protein DD434_14065 [Bacteroidales bacterium]|nr:hypothetical protein [Bacteroidales bacterium]